MLEHRLEVAVPGIADDADLHRASRLSSCCSAVIRRAMPGGGEPVRLELLGARRLLDQPVRDAERDDPHLGMRRLQRLGQVGAEAVHDGALLDRHQRAVLLQQQLQHRVVERLEETGVDHRAVDAVGGEQLGRLQRRLHHRADRQDGDVLAGPELLPGAVRHRRDLGRGTRLGGRLVARVAGAERAAGVRQRGAEQADQLVAVLGRRHRHARHRQHVRDVVQPHVGLAVLADQARAVHAERHRQVLHGDVVDDVVVRALEERAVDRAPPAGCPAWRARPRR